MNNKTKVKYWSMSSEKVLDYFGLTANGLESADAASRLEKYGENAIQGKKTKSNLMLFLQQFKNNIIVILLIATLISAFTGEWIDALIILIIVFASAILSFFQEYAASNAIEKLREKVETKTIVLRNGQQIEIASTKVVPGDIIKISTGSLIPADGLLLDSRNLFVNQAILTGESLPTEKKVAVLAEDATIEERINCVFMGTNVHSGSASVLVIETGIETEFGDIATNITQKRPETEFEGDIRQFGHLLTKIMLIMTLIVFALNVIFNRAAIDSLLFAVALAVGITPQLLPAIISITLSKGSREMATAGVIVRRLNAIENFGSMDILCTDKTGTLTEGKIRLDGAVDLDGKQSEDLFRLAYLNAKLQTGMINSLDQTIIDFQQLDISSVKKMNEIPFDFNRKRLSVIVQEKEETTIIVKGAFNSVLQVCDQVQMKERVEPINKSLAKKIQNKYEKWSNEGIRVLGIAEKRISLKNEYTIEDEKNMVFKGFLLLVDHPKADVMETLTELENKGVSLRIITGDNKLVAMHTAASVGLKVSGVLTGPEINKLTEEALLHRVKDTTLFAEVDPHQKQRIIMALKNRKYVVGYMGDGINDVPALDAADVSISVNNAVDVAKESADFVLMKNSLKVLLNGIELGRVTFENTLKYILVTTSANFGNMFSMAGVSLLLPFFPLLPKQILMINFLTDFPAINIAGDAVDAEILENPQTWDIDFIKKFMFTFGLISSVFDYLTFGLLFFVFKMESGLFRSSWFIFSVLTEVTVLILMRTRKPFYKSRPSSGLLYSSALVAIVTMILPYWRPINKILNIEPITPVIIIAILGLLVLYVIATEIGKYYFFKTEKNN